MSDQATANQEITFTSEITVNVIDVCGNDQYIIGAMKVLKEIPSPDQSDRGRIRYLMEHRHGTPFEHGCFILHVHAPIFVWREWHRHRIGFSYNEESARYAPLKPTFFIPSRNRPMIKTPDGWDGGGKWKAARPKFLTLDESTRLHYTGSVSEDDVVRSSADFDYDVIIQDMKRGYEDEWHRYQRQLARNLDPGLARDNMPVGVYSSCWVTCNPRSVMNFLSLRTHEPAAMYVSYPLYEIEQGARQLEKVFAERYPICYEAFNDFGRVAP